MGVYGPYTAVAGAVQQCAVDPDAQAVYIRNSSIYDLYVAASPIAPAATSAFGGWPWVARVPQGDRAGVVLPLERYAGAGFPGYIFVLPQLAPKSPAILSGSYQSAEQFSLEGFADPDAIPASYASPQLIATAAQQRVVAVPPSAQAYYTGEYSSGSDTDIGTLTLTAADKANTSVAAYFHGLYIVPYGGQSTAIVGTYQILARPLTSGGASGGTNLVVAQFTIEQVTSSNVAVPLSFSPHLPATLLWSPVASIDHITFTMHKVGGGTVLFDYYVLVTLDQSNSQPVPSIGSTIASGQGFAPGAAAAVY